MRPWICLLVLSAGLTAASALPAAANNMTARSPNVALNGDVQTSFLRQGFFRHRPFLGPFAFDAPVVFPGGFFVGDVMPGVAAGTPLPRRTAVEERPSVETTLEGVVIVRGPGSRHVAH